ncbi:uncharacterized protein CDV56_102395 [Aspergillus thermomutatus]|uniref:Nucleoside phosphorylase domain-containing protein n=1 Tax=Aspergillus thermomutatus TaxID=41047 RepID=A0A397GD05_ASPTH|nr:uncharacterized protein CDV56_102395 [Aspergillus thermomutatus]RHZ45970.1 hypothetical protein CDV56_102395 [Aspergillus thermomutatus]
MPCPAREEFQIGWICALPIEAAAAKEMLDEDFGILEEQDAADTNSYRLGRIGKHYVVIACLPGGQYGACAATTVANNMVRTFSKSLRIGLMVGVGGGIPSTDHDIRLGDIVISCPTGSCGGVIQYDMGKVAADGVFCRTGSLNSPPRSLLTAVNNMRAAELTDDPRYPEYLQRAIKRTRRTQAHFGRPSPQSDRLFKTKHEHPATAKNCDICPREWEETRSERDGQDPLPHYAPFGIWALCFEMEAAGLMLDFPCIIIRGICDYSDSHKNKQWQGYSALAAAAYAKELLEYVPRGQVSQENLAVDHLPLEVRQELALLPEKPSREELYVLWTHLLQRYFPFRLYGFPPDLADLPDRTEVEYALCMNQESQDSHIALSVARGYGPFDRVYFMHVFCLGEPEFEKPFVVVELRAKLREQMLKQAYSEIARERGMTIHGVIVLGREVRFYKLKPDGSFEGLTWFGERRALHILEDMRAITSHLMQIGYEVRMRD